MSRLRSAAIDAALFALFATALLGATVGTDEAPPLPAPATAAR